jgi:hypothetical protein
MSLVAAASRDEAPGFRLSRQGHCPQRGRPGASSGPSSGWQARACVSLVFQSPFVDEPVKVSVFRLVPCNLGIEVFLGTRR